MEALLTGCSAAAYEAVRSSLRLLHLAPQTVARSSLQQCQSDLLCAGCCKQLTPHPPVLVRWAGSSGAWSSASLLGLSESLA